LKIKCMFCKKIIVNEKCSSCFIEKSNVPYGSLAKRGDHFFIANLLQTLHLNREKFRNLNRDEIIQSLDMTIETLFDKSDSVYEASLVLATLAIRLVVDTGENENDIV